LLIIVTSDYEPLFVLAATLLQGLRRRAELDRNAWRLVV
jgi:hypothetical protein